MPVFQLGLFLLLVVIQSSVIAVSTWPQSSCSTVYEFICAHTNKDVYSFNGLAHCDNGDKMVYAGSLAFSCALPTRTSSIPLLLQAAPLAADFFLNKPSQQLLTFS